MCTKHAVVQIQRTVAILLYLILYKMNIDQFNYVVFF